MECFEYKGYRVRILEDGCPSSPDEYGDDDLFLTACHRQFSVEVDGFNHGNMNLEKIEEEYHVFPLYAYIHSGVALSLSRNGHPFNCPWDSGQVGYVFAHKNSWEGEELAEDAAKALVETWNEYLCGNVYGYIIEDQNGNEIDSCWGFYEYPNEESFVVECAKKVIDSLV